MPLRAVTKSALRHIDEISIREIKVAVFACTSIAALNALIFAFRIGYLFGNDACKCYVPFPHDDSYDFMRLKIELAFLIIAIALRFRRVVWFYVSLLTTVLIEVQYTLWYLDTKRWLREMQVSDFSQLPISGEWQHFLGIYRANVWDFVLFVFTTGLLVWQIRVVIARIAGARRRKQSADPLQ